MSGCAITPPVLVGSAYGAAQVYASRFTLTDNITANADVAVAASTFTDLAGNANNKASRAVFSVDTTKIANTATPRINIHSSQSELVSGESSYLSFDITGNPTDFSMADITVIGGSLSPLVANGTGYGTFIRYNSVFTPTPGFIGIVDVTVAQGAFADSAGLTNGDSATVLFAVDTQSPDIVSPSLEISSTYVDLRKGQLTYVDFTFSEMVAGFDLADITLTGGTLSNFTGSGMYYSALFMPSDNSVSPAAIEVATGSFADLSGNTNLQRARHFINVNTTSTGDSVAPILKVTAQDQYLTNGELTTVIFEPSEAIQELLLQDIVTQGGTLSNLQLNSGPGFTGYGYYSAIFTPAQNTGTASISITTGAIADLAGNPNAAGNTLVFRLDSLA